MVGWVASFGRAHGARSFALNQRHMYFDCAIASMNNGRRPEAKDRNTCTSISPHRVSSHLHITSHSEASASTRNMSNVCLYPMDCGRCSWSTDNNNDDDDDRIFHSVARKPYALCPVCSQKWNDESSPKIPIQAISCIAHKFHFMGRRISLDDKRPTTHTHTLWGDYVACRFSVAPPLPPSPSNRNENIYQHFVSV